MQEMLRIHMGPQELANKRQPAAWQNKLKHCSDLLCVCRLQSFTEAVQWAAPQFQFRSVTSPQVSPDYLQCCHQLH